MNIFVLDQTPEMSAKYHCDKHVLKMIIETAQLLSTAHHVLTPDSTIAKSVYRKTHVNHPCAVWVRTCYENYEWTYNLLLKLLAEYEFRYGKHHKTGDLTQYLKTPPANITMLGHMTQRPQCMPDDCKQESTVSAYRDYYIKHKNHFAKWTKRETPNWFEQRKIA